MLARAAGTQQNPRPEVSQQSVNRFSRIQIFLTEYDAAAKENAARRQDQKAAKRARPSSPRNAEDVQRYIDTNRRLRELIRMRLENGFRWNGGFVGGSKAYWRDACHYHGLVSDEDPVLKVFVSKLHAKRKLRTGHSKSDSDPSKSKLLSLDDEYTTGNADMRGFLRVELDAIFPSMEELCMMIYACLDESGKGGRVVMPNVVVGYVDAQGRVHNPHIIWILADSVCWTSAKADPAIKRLYAAVARGLTAKLLEIGADPGGLENPLRVKNPLSPLWSRLVVADDLYSLSELGAAVDLNVSRLQLDQRQADVILAGSIQTKEGHVVPSCRFFHELRTHAVEVVAEYKEADSLAQFRADVVMHAVRISSGSKEKQAKAVAYKVADYVWRHYDPSRIQKPRARKGILMDAVEGMDLHDRQVAGARFVSAGRKADSIRRGADAVLRLRAAGQSVTQAAVAASSAMALRTVKTHWASIGAAVEAADAKAAATAARKAAVLAAGARRCIVKKPAGGGSDKTANPSRPDWIPSLSPEAVRERAYAIIEAAEDSTRHPRTPSCTSRWEPTPSQHSGPRTPTCTMASTPLVDLAVGAVLDVDIPF